MGAVANCCSNVQHTLGVYGDAVADVEVLEKVGRVASGVVSAINHNATSVPGPLGEVLGGSIEMVNILDFINRIRWFVSATAKCWQETASMVCLTVLQFMESLQFLERVKALSLSRITANIGRIPVLGIALNVVNFGYRGFDAWTVLKDLSSNRDQLQACRETIAQSTRKLDEVSRSDDQLANQLINEHVQGITFTTPADSKAYLSVKYQSEVTKYTQELNHVKLERKMLWTSLVDDISNIALGILALAGVCGVAFLAVTSLPMIILGTVVAAIGLSKYLYQRSCKQVMAQNPVPLSIDFAQQMQLARDV